jgi:DNA-binding LacI/PurR family transcriptional regulator
MSIGIVPCNVVNVSLVPATKEHTMDARQSKPPTIIDLARATGLSKSVVSRALNEEPGVSSESRETVIAAATEMGYVANAMARRMRSHSVDTVGVLVRDPASVFYGSLLGELQSAASERGVRLITMTGSGKPDLEEERVALRSLLALRVDGLLVCSGLLPAADLYPFAERVPTVVVGRSEWDSRISSVCCDDEDGARQLVDHVIDGGYTRIIVPVPQGSTAPSLHIRANLLIARLQVRGMRPKVIEAESPDAVMKELRIDKYAGEKVAVMAPNDRWAVAMRERLAEMPEVLITGYDGVGVYTSPLLGLTTLVQPIAEIASNALDLVIEILTADREAEHLALPGSLRVAH